MNAKDYPQHKPKLSWFSGHRKATLRKLNALSKQFAGRSVFESRFTLEDQVLAHLIFSNHLPVRVFTRAKNEYFGVLTQTVDHFKANIEVISHQSGLASLQFVASFPDKAIEFEQNPVVAPITYILQSRRLAISGSRTTQPAGQNGPTEVKTDRQETIFHPLFQWSDAQLYEYVLQYKIPFELLPGADVIRIRNWSERRHRISRIFDWLPQNILVGAPEKRAALFSRAAL